MANFLTPPRGWDPTEKTIHRTFRTGTFENGLAFVNEIGQLAATANHHPNIILSYPSVIVTLMSHDEGAVTEKDINLAEQINNLWQRYSSNLKK